MAKEVKIYKDIKLYKDFNTKEHNTWGTFEVEIDYEKNKGRVKNNTLTAIFKEYSRWNKLNYLGGSLAPTETKRFFGLNVNGEQAFFTVTDTKTVKV